MGTIRITATDNMGFSVGMIHLRVHEPDQCVGEVCVIHHPSQHPLSGAPMHWRSDRRIIERICQHGCGHTSRGFCAATRMQSAGVARQLL